MVQPQRDNQEACQVFSYKAALVRHVRERSQNAADPSTSQAPALNGAVENKYSGDGGMVCKIMGCLVGRLSSGVPLYIYVI